MDNIAYILRNKETGAYFCYEDEDSCAYFYRDTTPHLATEGLAEEILHRLQEKDLEYDIFEARETVEKNLNFIGKDAQTYISNLEIVAVEWKIVEKVKSCKKCNNHGVLLDKEMKPSIVCPDCKKDIIMK